MEKGGAKFTQKTREEKRPERHTRVERELGQHEHVLLSTVTHVRVQAVLLAVKSNDPDSELENAGKENDDAADLNGFQFIARVVRELVRQLVGQRETSHKRQREGVEQAHEARCPGDVEEQGVVNKPQQADGDEGTKIGQVLRTVELQSCCQAAAKLLLHYGRVGNVVLTEGDKKIKDMLGLSAEDVQVFT